MTRFQPSQALFQSSTALAGLGEFLRQLLQVQGQFIFLGHGQGVLQASEDVVCLSLRMVEGSATFDQFLQAGNHMSIKSGLLARQYIDVGMFEIPEELTLEPAFPRSQESLRHVQIVLRKALSALRFSQSALGCLQNRAT